MKSVVEYVKEKTMEYESQTKVQQIQSMLTGKFQVRWSLVMREGSEILISSSEYQRATQTIYHGGVVA